MFIGAIKNALRNVQLRKARRAKARGRLELENKLWSVSNAVHIYHR